MRMQRQEHDFLYRHTDVLAEKEEVRDCLEHCRNLTKSVYVGAKSVVQLYTCRRVV